MNRHFLSIAFIAFTLNSTVANSTLAIPQSEEAPKAPRGEPIKPLVPRGEPIQVLQPSASAPNATKPATPTSSRTESPDSAGEFVALGFDKLSSFKYEVPDDTVKAAPNLDPDQQIPVLVKGFNNKRVCLKGFMLPLKVEAGLVTEMLILRDQSACCFGATPKINEWVSVKMVGGGVKPIMDQAITLYGTLKVGAMRENGYIVGIYQLDGEKMQGPPGT